MKLLIETRDFSETNCLVENIEGKRAYFISGPFLQSEVKNHNR